MRSKLTGLFLFAVLIAGSIACVAKTADEPIRATPKPTLTQDEMRMLEKWRNDPTVEFVLNNGQSFLFDTPTGNELDVASGNIREEDFEKEDGSKRHGAVAGLAIVINDRSSSARLPPAKTFNKLVYIGQILKLEGFTSNFEIEILDIQDKYHDQDNRGYVVIRAKRVAQKGLP